MPSKHIADMRLVPGVLFLMAGTMAFYACNNDEDKILRDANNLFCQRQLLAESSQKLWEDVAYHIGVNLPESIDSVTRKRMIEIKNAPILKSFNAYKRLPDSVKIIVDKAEIADKKLVDEIAEVSFSIDSLEIKKLRFLTKVGPESSRGKRFLAQYNEYLASPCKTNVIQ